MGIIVNEMRMPETCLDCPMQFGGMCYVQPAWVDDSRVAPTVDEAWKQKKPDWCPLVELVRCKDCDRVHVDFDDEGRTRYSCNHYNPLRVMVSDDGMGFCSNGRRQK